MGQRIVQVDAFASKPFEGNPAAVCVLDAPADASWMQHVAMEMNLAETAYVVRNGARFDLRWFTPAIEVDLCGHATVASAHVLWTEGYVPVGEPIRFATRSGELVARRLEDWIEVDFPAETATADDLPDGVVTAMGFEPVDWAYSERLKMLVLEANGAAEVRSCAPDFVAIAKMPYLGIIATSPGEGSGYDFISRFFAPAAGINEDPVTGAAHCVLGPYWEGKLGRSNFLAYQASPRGGVVRVAVRGGRVALGGQAVTVLRGELSAEG